MYSFIIDVPMYFSGFFCTKATLKWILDASKFRLPFFSGQSLLLSTTVLNDNNFFMISIKQLKLVLRILYNLLINVGNLPQSN